MKQTLQLRLGQQLTMTPQLQQAIRLLQLSTIDLEHEIQDALESNPMLEMDEQHQENSKNDETLKNEEQSYNTASDEALDSNALPQELPVDVGWDTMYPNSGTQKSKTNYDGENNFPEPADDSSQSLNEHLLWQLQLTPMSELDHAIAVALIDAIDDDGYLNTSIADIISSIGTEEPVEEDEVIAVLHRIQQFDPVGVGSRDLSECLLIQLNQLPETTPWKDKAGELLKHHDELLAHRDYKTVMRKLKVKKNEFQEILQLIQSLNPRPGNTINKIDPQYIIPDVYVRKQNDSWVVTLNDSTLPRIKVNDGYAGLVNRADNSSENTYLRDQLQEARWFIKSLQSRSETLFKVATCIAKYQREFLEHGEEAMKPLVLHDIADALEMHESTISRVTTQKYIHTPHGIFELKFFFSSHVATASGGECSSTAIRALLKKLIAAEDTCKPLSDSKIAAILKEQGINIARRTIAKYREAIGIPPSNERRSLL